MLSNKWFAGADDLVSGKPTEQSSFCHQETGSASDSVDGMPGHTVLPTSMEMNPWWQVDLLEVYRIEELRLFNDPVAPRRLRFFTLLFSLDGAEWYAVYAKKNNEIVGTNGNGWRIKLRTICHARHIRLRLDGYDQLYFIRLEAFGCKPKQPVTSVGTTVPETNYLKSVKIDGLDIYVDRDNYSEILTDALEAGRYEQRERGLLKSALRAGDRVLEVGTALGVISMLAARVVGPENILTFDGNPQMVEHARRNFDRNSLSRIRAENAILQNANTWKGPDEKVDFFISRNFWASGLTRNSSTVSVVSVPTRCLEDVVDNHNANVLICDIEGGEIELLMDADLRKIDTLMMEVHYSRGEAPVNRLIRRLVNSGFNINLRASGSCVILMHRGLRLKRRGGRQQNSITPVRAETPR